MQIVRDSRRQWIGGAGLRFVKRTVLHQLKLQGTASSYRRRPSFSVQRCPLLETCKTTRFANVESKQNNALTHTLDKIV